MSDKSSEPGKSLSQEQVEGVGGGLSCSPTDILPIVQSLTTAYESLVDFTSHVIERVAGAR